MGLIDYSREPQSDIAFVDMKSFYASVECVDRGLNPLRTSLCVMSRADNSNGLILASSPVFKKVFGKKNVGRSYDLPFNVKTRRFNFRRARILGQKPSQAYIAYIEYWARRTLIVPPRMDLYIHKNMEIQEILQNYASRADIHPYSIDEAFVDLTQSLRYLTSGHRNLNRRQQLDLVSGQIQEEIWQKTGIYSSVGMSNSNPLLAKLSLDNEAKSQLTMRANWSYEDVETKVWSIPKLTDFWGIGDRTQFRLENRLHIYSVRDLAMANPDDLKREFGIMGVQLWFHAHGVDESNVHYRYRPRASGLGNSQVLPRDYHRRSEIELVLSEMAEQVAIRLRKIGKKATKVAIYVGFSDEAQQKSLNHQMTVEPTQMTRDLVAYVRQLFQQHYQGGSVRKLGVRYGGLVDEDIHLISLFEDLTETDRQVQLEKTIDQIRQRFGFLSVQKATVLLEGSRSIVRSKLVGGHSAGGLDGLK